MVINIPTAEDFNEVGSRYLDLGWDMAMKVLRDATEAESWLESGSEEYKAYWKSSETELATALTLVQQGAEFLLKAKIAEVSVWLLVRNEPKEFPRGSSTTDVSFSDFRTLDAQDLIRVYNTVGKEKIPPDFVEAFDRQRAKRNSIMHSVGGLPASVLEIVRYVLVIVDILIGPHKWPEYRRYFLANDRVNSNIDGAPEYVMAEECRLLTNLLENLELQRFFGFNKKQRAYLCSSCHYSQEEAHDTPLWVTAQLRPNTPICTSVYCFACGESTEVKRIKCSHDDCKGNVIDAGLNVCLTCLGEQ